MSTKFYERNFQEWDKEDVVKRLQCIIATPNWGSHRYDPKVNKTMKDARKEICQLRNSNVALKEAYNKIYMLQLKNSRLRDKIRNCASSAKLMIDILDEKG